MTFENDTIPRRFALWAALPFLVTLGACQQTPVPPPGEITARFQCEDGSGFDAVFNKENETATIVRPEADDIVLPIARSGSGYLYSDGTYSLRGKGKAATFSTTGGVDLSCHSE